MPVNRYFNHVNFQTEQDLVQDLIDESIQIYGHEAFYLKREDRNIDKLLGEDPRMAFESAYPIELYLKSFDAFQGQSEFISKFGLQIEDQAMFLVSFRRFDVAVNQAGANISRPREGDMIYIEMTPTNRYLFEIRFVENKEQLFQLGKLYTYELRCEMMNFSNEQVKTGDEDIDGAAQARAYTISMTFASGSGAFEIGETVYQGATLDTATATGEVYTWDSPVLTVQQITGEFANATPVIGETSGAIWTVNNTTPNTAPTIHDPISDNAFLQADTAGVIVTRGTHLLDD